MSKIRSEWVEAIEDEEAEYLIRPMNVEEFEQVAEVDESGNIGIPFKNYGRVLRSCVDDWRGERHDGDKFKKSKMLNFGFSKRAILVQKILSISNLDGEDEKNS